MSVKVTIGESKTQSEKPFPKLVTLKLSGGVFLAKSETEIICIDKGDSIWDVFQTRKGEFTFNQSYYYDNYFTDFNEPITLQNQ